jgi:putative hydrolase of the HAD superfamily
MRAVFLDGMGTLLDLAPPWDALVQRLRSTHEIDLDRATAERAFRAEILYYRAHHTEGRDTKSLADLRRRCAHVLHQELPPDVQTAIGPGELRDLMLDCLRFTVFADARQTLIELREQALRLIVVSNWDISLGEVLDRAGLLCLLDGVLSSAEVGYPKPDPRIFTAALELAGGVLPADAMHVGDSPELDVRGALSAGITPILLHRGETVEGEATGVPGDPLALGVSVISSLRQLPQLVG